VLASHYLAAYETAPDDPDATEIKERARDLLARAGERAASLAASEEAAHYFEQAASLAEEPLAQARLLERAGEMALRGGMPERGEERFEQALALFGEAGESHHAARVTARLGEVQWRSGHLDEALDRMERAFAELEHEEADADVAALAAQIGRLYVFQGDIERASARLETALELAESLWLPEVLAEALNSKGIVASTQSRLEEAHALMERALGLALEYELPAAAMRAFNNVADSFNRRDRCGDAAALLEQGIAFARRVGDSRWEATLVGELAWSQAVAGQWADAFAAMERTPEDLLVVGNTAFAIGLAEPFVAQGRLDDARRLVSIYERLEASADVTERAAYHAMKSFVLLAEGVEREALEAAQAVVDAIEELGTTDATIKVAFPVAVEAALALGERPRAEQILTKIESLPPGRLAPSVRADAGRLRGRLAADDGDDSRAGSAYAAAESTFREFGMPFKLATTQVEHGEWLARIGRAEEAAPLLAEARETFERLEAKAWLERLEARPAAEAAV
jgi:tetratricopeptide (TPR) repeat protein